MNREQAPLANRNGIAATIFRFIVALLFVSCLGWFIWLGTQGPVEDIAERLF